MRMISAEQAEGKLTWLAMMEALVQGHQLPRASLGDNFSYRGDDTLLTRSCWVDGLGAGVKAAVLVPSNVKRNQAVINGGMMLFNDLTGEMEALIDFDLITKWKTATDSLLGAKLLARANSKRILIVGAGKVADSMISAYASLFPDAHFSIFNRTESSARALVAKWERAVSIEAVSKLDVAVESSDIISTATMSSEALVKGDWLQAGQHLDLIGAYRSDMRELDDIGMQRARIFVDCRDTTIEHIGEIKMPIASGAICEADILADLYDLIAGESGRQNETDITLFKNGGGAHLDLMIARAILSLV